MQVQEAATEYLNKYAKAFEELAKWKRLVKIKF
jgi:hypothetical protein